MPKSFESIPNLAIFFFIIAICFLFWSGNRYVTAPYLALWDFFCEHILYYHSKFSFCSSKSLYFAFLKCYLLIKVIQWKILRRASEYAAYRRATFSRWLPIGTFELILLPPLILLFGANLSQEVKRFAVGKSSSPFGPTSLIILSALPHSWYLAMCHSLLLVSIAGSLLQSIGRRQCWGLLFWLSFYSVAHAFCLMAVHLRHLPSTLCGFSVVLQYLCRTSRDVKRKTGAFRIIIIYLLAIFYISTSVLYLRLVTFLSSFFKSIA